MGVIHGEKGISFPSKGEFCGFIRLPMAKALNILFIFLTACLTTANAQTVEISPPELARIPVSEVGFESGRYWQQLHVVLGQDDSPSDTAAGLELQATESDVRAMAVSIVTIRCWRKGSLLRLESRNIPSLSSYRCQRYHIALCPTFCRDLPSLLHSTIRICSPRLSDLETFTHRFAM